MTVDPLHELRETRATALASPSFSDVTRMIANAGLEAQWTEISDGNEGLPSSLTVFVGGQGDLSATAASSVSEAVQRATAIVARGFRDPMHATRLYRGDVEKAPVVQRGQVGRTLVFEVKRSRTQPDQLPVKDQVSAVEQAISEIVQVLPETSDDFRSMDAILGQSTPVRLAVSDLVDAAAKTHGLRFLWAVPGSQAIESVISPLQAEELQSSLHESRVERSVRPVVGRLDGVRTKRRLFYLELSSPEGHEIWGAFDADLAEKVRELIDKTVLAQVEVTVVRDAAGREGRETFRLVELEEAPTLLDD